MKTVSAAMVVLLLAAPPIRAHDVNGSDQIPQVFEEEPVIIYDAPVFDQNGRDMNFLSDAIGEKSIVLTFFYARCPTFCPAYHAVFQSLQAEIKKSDVKNVRLISVSIDPQNDSKKVLKELAGKLEANGDWLMISGSPKEMQILLKSLGLPRGKPEDHPPMFLVGNPKSGKLTRYVQIPQIDDILERLSAGATAQK
jgi:protein SCO1